MTHDEIKQEILTYLRRMVTKDALKGGSGCRTTAEVATFVGIKRPLALHLAAGVGCR